MATQNKAAQHTPGPWTLYRTDRPRATLIIRGDERELAVAEIDADDVEAEANARLIAAAPRMLEWTRKFVAWEANEMDDETLSALFAEARAILRDVEG